MSLTYFFRLCKMVVWLIGWLVQELKIIYLNVEEADSAFDCSSKGFWFWSDIEISRSEEIHQQQIIKCSPMIQYSRSLCSTRAHPLWFTWKQLVLKKWILVFKTFFTGIYEQECPWNSFHASCNIWEGKQSCQSNLNRILRNSEKWTNISSLPVLV